MSGLRASALPKSPLHYPGHLVLVVGPSGAGKDTLINAAKFTFAGDTRFHFVRRIVTRASSQWEEHDTLDEAAFLSQLAEGEFCLHWHAHGLYYGIPKIVESWLQVGDTVVFNCSRTAISEARAKYRSVSVVRVTASPSVLAARLAGRARDSNVSSRLNRANLPAEHVKFDHVIVNDDRAEDAIADFIQFLESATAYFPFKRQGV